MGKLKFDYSKALPFVGQHEIDAMAKYIKIAHDTINDK